MGLQRSWTERRCPGWVCVGLGLGVIALGGLFLINTGPVGPPLDAGQDEFCLCAEIEAGTTLDMGGRVNVRKDTLHVLAGPGGSVSDTLGVSWSKVTSPFRQTGPNQFEIESVKYVLLHLDPKSSFGLKDQGRTLVITATKNGNPVPDISFTLDRGRFLGCCSKISARRFPPAMIIREGIG